MTIHMVVHRFTIKCKKHVVIWFKYLHGYPKVFILELIFQEVLIEVLQVSTKQSMPVLLDTIYSGLKLCGLLVCNSCLVSRKLQTKQNQHFTVLNSGFH